MELQGIDKKLTRLWNFLVTPKYAVLFLALIASAIRLLPVRFKYLLGYDPYFHLAYIRYALEKGEWVNFFPYATGPWGFQVHTFHPLGLWMTPSYVYKPLSIFGVSLYNAFRITPVIFGVLTVLFTYLAVLKLYGKAEAFLSAFFLAVLFGHVFRSMAGYYRGDNYMLFWYSVALFGIALAISENREEWKYKRLGFYLIPAIASGLAAVFWQAYYPIFIFLLGSALMLAVGAFLLDNRDTFVDSILLILATGIGALLANALGGYFGYGMAGASRELGRVLAEEFNVQFGFLQDAFLIMYLKYAVPLSIGIVIMLIIFSKFIKDSKQKGAIVGISLVIALWLGIRYYGTINDFILGLFPESPIVETSRVTFSDLWKAYGVAIFITPTFLLNFIPQKARTRDFILLGLITPAFPMVVLWTRFVFIGSLAVATTAGIGITRVYEEVKKKVDAKRLGAIALISVLSMLVVITALQGFQNTRSIRPLVNDYWERALSDLKRDSSINDVVLTWWDQGNWITYFSERAPVAQISPNKWVAQYYLGLKGGGDLMNWGVDYVVVSYDTLMKFGAIVETANVSPSGYAMVPMHLSSSTGSMLVFSTGQYSIILVPRGDSWEVRVNAGGAILTPKKVFLERGTEVETVPQSGKPNADAYVYVNLNYGYAVLMNGKTFNTTLARLMFSNEYPPNYELAYSDGGLVKIFRFNHPNVIVRTENGSVVFEFTNTTGTKLGIFGYLDNGSRVFKKWYNVEGKESFRLPGQLNGSVVVRYAYVEKSTVLDRGVFRVDDVLRRG